MAMGTRMTPFGAFSILWIVLATFNFGFGTSELNPLQRALTCPAPPVPTSAKGLPLCIELSNTQFGYVTAAFTLGGFLGSLLLAPLQKSVSSLSKSKRALLLSSVSNVVGGLIQASSTSWVMLATGRLFMGIGSGIALVVVPSFLNDIAPSSLQGSIGVLNQLSIVIGILSAQALGVSRLGDVPTSSSDPSWRWVPVVSSLISILHLLLAPIAIDAPSDVPNGNQIRASLWTSKSSSSAVRVESNDQSSAEAESLLAHPQDSEDDSAPDRASTAPTTSIGALLSLAFLPSQWGAISGDRAQKNETDRLRRGTRMIVFTQMAQQLSGVNAVLYFSTGILSDALSKGGGSGEEQDGDRLARLIGLGVTVVNFIMTFPPIPLIDEKRFGRKRLLQLSSASMALSAAALGFALLNSYIGLAAISIFTFTAGFSAGLGPIPFLILPELVPRYAVPSAASLGIGCNWLANITLATVFLPLKDALGGKVFFVFVVIDSIIFFVISNFYRYEELPLSSRASTSANS